MTGIKPTALTPVRAESLLNLKGLEGAALARMEQTVKSAKDTLALADRLQTMRDATRALWRLEDSLSSRSALGSGSLSGGKKIRLLDISL